MNTALNASASKMQYQFGNSTSEQTLLNAAHNSAIAIINAFVTSVGKVLCSTPIIRVSSNRVVVQLFYYASQGPKGTVFTNAALDALGAVLSQLYPAHTVVLQFVRLQYPYLNSSILAQYLAINAAKYGFNRLQNTLLNAVPFGKVNDSNGPNICGVKIQLSGLLTTQRAAPRKTVYTASAGTFHGPNCVVDSSYSNVLPNSKSAVGAYTVKV